jgi:hypothetical protein
VILLAVGVAIRYALLFSGLWADEGISYFDVSAPTWSQTLARVDLSETNPPVFFLLMRAWVGLAGHTEFALHALPFIFGLAAIPLTYILARQVASTNVAFVGAGLIAVLTPAVYYSAETRPYSLAMVLAIVVVYAFLRAFIDGERRWEAPWVLTAVVLIYTHYVGILIIAALVITTVALTRVERRRMFASLAIIAVAFLPWLPHLVQQIVNGTPWVEHRSIAMRALSVFPNLAAVLPLPLRAGTIVPFAGGVAAMAILVAYLYRLRKRTGADSAADEKLLLMGSTFVLVLSLEALMNETYSRYLVPVLPLAAVVYARSIADAAEALAARVRLPRGAAIATAAAVCIVVVGWNAVLTMHDAVSPKSGMRAAFRATQPAEFHRPMFLVAGDFAGPSFGYYAPDGATVRGFARWDHPEIFTLPRYAATWSEPALVERTLRSISAMAADGYDGLILVRPAHSAQAMRDKGSVPFARVDELRARLQRRYALLRVRDYPGRIEPVSVYEFDLHRTKTALK